MKGGPGPQGLNRETADNRACRIGLSRNLRAQKAPLTREPYKSV